MKKIEIFDPALCCGTGVCGVNPEQALVAFAADVSWAKKQGASIERFNLAQQPLIFAENAIVKAFLKRSGQDALPLVLVDGEMALAGRYPTRKELAHWCNLELEPETPPMPGSSCCGGNSASSNGCC